MNRRRFLSYSLAATAGFVAFGAWRWNVEVASTIPRFVPDDDRAFEARLERLESVVGLGDRSLLLALVPDLQSAVAIGRHARSTEPGYHVEDVVLDRLRSAILEPWRRAKGTHGALRSAFQAAVASDHRDERVVILDSWVLAATRVELCSLALLVHERLGARVVAP